MRRAEAKARFLGVCNYKPSLPPAYWGTSDPSKSVAWEFGYRTMQTGESARLPSPVLSIHGEREDPHARTQRRRRRGRLGVGERHKRYVQRCCIPVPSPALLRCPAHPSHRRSRCRAPAAPLPAASGPAWAAVPDPPCDRHPLGHRADTGSPLPRPACGAGRPALALPPLKSARGDGRNLCQYSPHRF